MTKQCFKCRKRLDLSSFYIHKSGKQKGQALHMCKGCCNKASREWQNKNSKRDARVKTQWYKKNRVRHNTLVYAWRKRSGEKQLNYRIAHNLRVRVRQVLRREGSKKVTSTIALIGCSVPALRLHLEKQFKPGMSWETYGLWEIDHIRPCASFDLRDREQQKLCFHYTNLQPLWKIENQQKKDKYPLDAALKLVQVPPA